MKLCIFSGTFNPIHKAHIRVALYVAKNFEFDKILFIPAYKPPHKDYDSGYSKHRYNMVKSVTDKYSEFEVSNIEYERETKSYTYLTVKELYQKYDVTGKINVIIGTDAFKDIESWYETDKLKQIVDFIVFERGDNRKDLDYLKSKGYNFRFADLDFRDISSTKLREAIAKGKDISEFVESEVEEYIKKNGLYGYKKTA